MYLRRSSLVSRLCSDFQNTVPSSPDFDGEVFQPPSNLFRNELPLPVVTYLPAEFGLAVFNNLASTSE